MPVIVHSPSDSGGCMEQLEIDSGDWRPSGSFCREARDQSCPGAWCWAVLLGLFLQNTGRKSVRAAHVQLSSSLCSPLFSDWTVSLSGILQADKQVSLSVVSRIEDA